MKPEEILGGKERVVDFLVEKGFTVNSSYVDAAHPKANFFDLPNHGLLAVEEFSDLNEVRIMKNHFLVDLGLTHCSLVGDGRILFYRNYGDVRYFTYSSRTSDYVSKLDKLRRLGEDIDILFQLKDVSNDFYETFRQKRDELVRAIRTGDSDVQKYLVSQRIFDRIFFIYFLCHRGLVRFRDGRPVSGTIFFRIMLESGKFLETLYGVFNAFNSEKDRSFEIGEYGFQLPFLNGGLFRLGQEEVDLRITLSVLEWRSIFQFLDSYHWIIEDDIEETEQEKILTPEILGHVYERSVVEWERKGFEEEVAEASGRTERKSKGVYYTPEIITDFICRNTIQSNLLSRIPRRFSDFKSLLDKGSRADHEDALRVLNSISILDPACGSGAFLIKAADILFQLKSNLIAKTGEKPDHYRIKLGIITKNIFGVDLLEGATEIAKLRLWLWLVSSFSESGQITPLPNIEYNIIVGNSLIGWVNEKFGATLSIPLTEETDERIDSLLRVSGNPLRSLLAAKELLKSYELGDYVSAYSLLYEEYKGAHGDLASALKAILIEIKKVVYASIDHAYLSYLNEKPIRKIKASSRELGAMSFHWGYDFGQIIERGGFDVIIGNPPYVRVQRLDHKQVDLFFQVYPNVAHKKFDMSIIFIARCLQLVDDNGRIGLISSSQWMNTDYGEKLRGYLSEGYLHEIIDFGSLPVFSGVSTYPAMFFLGRTRENSLTYRRIMTEESLSTKGIETTQSRKIPFSSLGSESWSFGQFNLEEYMKEVGLGFRPITDLGSFFVGTLTGADSVFVIDNKEISRMHFEKELLVPYAFMGKEIEQFSPVTPSKSIIYPYQDDGRGNSVLMRESQLRASAPNIYRYLRQFRPQLEQRLDSRKKYAQGQDWYRYLRPGRFRYIYPPKLIIRGLDKRARTGSLGPRTAFNGANCPAFIANRPEDAPFLIGLLNSRLITYYLRSRCPAKLQDYRRFNTNSLNSIPIPNSIDPAKLEDLKSCVKALVESKVVSESKGDSTEKLDELNELVYDIYQLDSGSRKNG